MLPDVKPCACGCGKMLHRLDYPGRVWSKMKTDGSAECVNRMKTGRKKGINTEGEVRLRPSLVPTEADETARAIQELHLRFQVSSFLPEIPSERTGLWDMYHQMLGQGLPSYLLS